MSIDSGGWVRWVSSDIRQGFGKHTTALLESTDRGATRSRRVNSPIVSLRVETKSLKKPSRMRNRLRGAAPNPQTRPEQKTRK